MQLASPARLPSDHTRQTTGHLETESESRTLSYRFPDGDKAIKHGAQMIVRESSRRSSYVWVISETRSVPASTR